ncbi:hypothetical protein [Nocardioides sp. WS12]|uniref:hypothetical protein n=1 Tax=Nocardioides sp. WS12 TaxID=2486272 RepID=UPI0015FD16F1|nr:hypothetical protein [Nocardioides sp. WS12]
MSDLLQLLPIYAFMLIPVWIPLIAMTVGGLRDAISAPARRATAPRAAHAARAVSRSGGPRVPAAGTAA